MYFRVAWVWTCAFDSVPHPFPRLPRATLARRASCRQVLTMCLDPGPWTGAWLAWRTQRPEPTGWGKPHDACANDDRREWWHRSLNSPFLAAVSTPGLGPDITTTALAQEAYVRRRQSLPLGHRRQSGSEATTPHGYRMTNVHRTRCRCFRLNTHTDCASRALAGVA